MMRFDGKLSLTKLRQGGHTTRSQHSVFETQATKWSTVVSTTRFETMYYWLFAYLQSALYGKSLL